MRGDHVDLVARPSTIVGVSVTPSSGSTSTRQRAGRSPRAARVAASRSRRVDPERGQQRLGLRARLERRAGGRAAPGGSARASSARCRRSAGSTRGPRAPCVVIVKRKTPFSATHDPVDAAAVEVGRLAAALVDHDQSQRTLSGCSLAQPLRAVRGAGLLVGGDDHEQLARVRPPALLAQRERRGRPRRPPGSSCRARRGPRRSRPSARPTTGRRDQSPGSASTVSTWPQVGRASGRRTLPRRRAIRFGPPVDRRRAARTRSRRPSSVSRRNSCAACSFAGRIDRVERISRDSSSVVRRSSCAAVGHAASRGRTCAMADQLFDAGDEPRGQTHVPAADQPLAARMRPGDARRVRRPGAPARRGIGAAARDRGGPAALDDPLRPARAPARRRSRGWSPATRAPRSRSCRPSRPARRRCAT